MTSYEYAPRMKSQRLVDRANRDRHEAELMRQQQQKPISKPQVADICPGLNEITDALEAFPCDLIRYFTLLREIDAKCVYTIPYLKAYITRFLQIKRTHPKRELLLERIKDLIKDLMPCLEEKMHVATIACDTVAKHVNRINQNYESVLQNEIPEKVRIGPLIHPCMKVTEHKSAQSQRSESRREALAAKKASRTETEVEDESARNTPVPSNGTPSYANPSKKVKKDRKDGDHLDAAAAQSLSSKKRKPLPGSVDESRRVKSSKPKKEKRVKDEYANTTGGSTPTPVPTPVSAAKSESAATSPYDAEPVYCYCQQVSYGEMVGCDGESCEREWFHLPCTGLKELPRGEWYCDDCKVKLRKR
ncbi:hypothetical protein KL929_002359 [Ogataea haglerorum]|nr:hypothetical protein KL929_002359 [Ogataea haglerorum]